VTLSSFAALLYDVSIRSSALLVLAFGINRALRGSSASDRHLVWAAALSGTLVLPLLSAALRPCGFDSQDPIASIFVAGPDGAGVTGESGSTDGSINRGIPGDTGLAA
jgi:hypothetical protein